MNMMNSGSPMPMAGGGFNMNSMMDIIKTQYIMGSFQSFMSSTGMQKHSAILMMLVMMLYEQLSRYIPQFLDYIILSSKKALQPKEDQPKLTAPNKEPPKEKPINSFITYTRAPSDTPNEQRVNAILFYICNLPQVKSLRFNGYEFIPSFKDPISIENDIWFQVTNVNENTSFSPSPSNGSSSVSRPSTTYETITFKLFSYDHDIKYLHRFVEQLVDQYEQEKKNKLGNEVYYFDQISAANNSGIPGSKQKLIFFRKSKFYTNRKLENVYFKQSDELIQRVRFFMNRRDWYDAKGVPHTLGVVMYGHPGCGKTSTIKAIANETKRHIFNINLSEIKSKEAFKSLFFSDSVNIMEGNDRMDNYNIPMKNRVYVIEDIDAMNSIVLKRDGKHPSHETQIKETKAEKKPDPLFNMPTREDDHSDDLDLATLLNVLDGIRETPGRIIILSTNYPERLDQALLRPGRFDVMIHFDKHDNNVLIQHVESFYDTTLSKSQKEALLHPSLHRKWTPAEVGQILFCHVHHMDTAIQTLVEKTPQELFKYSQLQKDYDESHHNTESLSEVQSLLSIATESQENPVISSTTTTTTISSASISLQSTNPPVQPTLQQKTLSPEEKQELDTFFYPGLKYFVEPPYKKEWEAFIAHNAHKDDPANYKIKQLVQTTTYPTDPQRIALYKDHLRILRSTQTMEAIFEDYSEKIAIVNDVIYQYVCFYKDNNTNPKYGKGMIIDRVDNEEFLLNEKYVIMNLCTHDEYKTMLDLNKNVKLLQNGADSKIATSYEPYVLSQLQLFTNPKSVYENIAKTRFQNMKHSIDQIKFQQQFKEQDALHEAKYLNPDEAYKVDYTQNNVIMPNLLDTNDLSDQCMSYDDAFGDKVMDASLPLTYQGPNAEPIALHEKSFSSVHGVGYDGETNDAYRALERKIAQDYFQQHGKPPSNPNTESYKDFFRRPNTGSAFYDNDDDIYPM